MEDVQYTIIPLEHSVDMEWKGKFTEGEIWCRGINIWIKTAIPLFEFKSNPQMENESESDEETQLWIQHEFFEETFAALETGDPCIVPVTESELEEFVDLMKIHKFNHFDFKGMSVPNYDPELWETKWTLPPDADICIYTSARAGDCMFSVSQFEQVKDEIRRVQQIVKENNVTLQWN